MLEYQERAGLDQRQDGHIITSDEDEGDDDDDDEVAEVVPCSPQRNIVETEVQKGDEDEPLIPRAIGDQIANLYKYFTY
jgi:hypothetical protein